MAAALADLAVGLPLNGMVELAGPEALPIDEFVGRYMIAKGDARKVIPDPNTPYSGAILDERGLAPGANPRVGRIKFQEWVGRA